MINILIALSTALFSFEMFSITAKVSGLNKTMLNIPMAIFSYSVPQLLGEHFYFDKTTLENKLDEYFQTNITRLVNEYTVSYSYYNTSYQGICMSDQCDQVRVTLTANIDGLYNFRRTMEYYLGEGNG